MNLVRDSIPTNISISNVDVWFQDESRVGQQGSQTRIWAKTGTRPRVVKQQQFLYQYIFGAVCPSQKSCAGIVVPYANHMGLSKHLEEIAHQVPEGRFAVVVMDRAGWHLCKNINVPNNMSILHLPPYSPELNPQEQIWQHLKDRYLANRVFDNHQDILDACCQAWNKLAQMPDLIKSIATREWAII